MEEEIMKERGIRTQGLYYKGILLLFSIFSLIPFKSLIPYPNTYLLP